MNNQHPTMSNLYTLPLALAILAGGTVSAQAPKPQNEKHIGFSTANSYNRHGGVFDVMLGGGLPNTCAEAFVLPIGTSCNPIPFDASNATQSLAPIACGGFTSSSANDLWFTFTSVSTSTIVEVLGIGQYDAVLQVFTGSCGSLTPIGCVDATFPPNSTLEVANITGPVGTTYYLRTYNYTPPAIGQQQFTICAYGGLEPPPNDDCDGATIQNLAVGQTLTLSGDNTGATVDVDNFTLVWEAFTTTECTNVTINYCVAGFEFDNFLIELATNCPDFLTGLVAGTFDDCTVTYEYLPAGTYWIPVLVDPANTPIGPYTIEVSAVACPPGYCTAGATSTSFEKIANVTFANINNSSTSTAGYEDFTSITANVQQGQTYPITVTISNPYEEDMVLVWIDFDQNESFDANELVYESPMGTGPHTGPIAIPANAALGQTRMRIRLHDATLGPNFTPCGTSTYGQVEDYTVNITSGGGGGGPVNDDCANATSLTVFPPGGCPAGAVDGDNSQATQDGGEPECDETTDEFLDVWYTFNSGANSAVTINIGVGTIEDLVLEVFEGVVCQGASLVCSIGTSALLTNLPVNPNTNYTVRVSSNTQFGGGGTFTICVTGTPVGSYCDAGATSTSFEKISNVTFANIDNTSTGTAGYEDFTSIVGNVSRGETYQITVTISDPYEEDVVLVWIDYDQNAVFDEDELVYESPMGEGPHSGSITIPFNAELGATRMRIRLHDSVLGGNPTPCGNSSFGQVEDYTLLIDIGSGLAAVSMNDWALFPNPTDGDLSLLGTGGATDLAVFDLTGRLLHNERRVITAGQVERLQLAGRLAPGTYVLRALNDEGQRELRFVVR
jgi:hypothetical protein